jgi:hypothetical protein
MAKKKAKKSTKRARRGGAQSDGGALSLAHANLTFLRDVVGATLKLTRHRAEELDDLYRYLGRADVASRQRTSKLLIRE